MTRDIWLADGVRRFTSSELFWSEVPKSSDRRLQMFLNAHVRWQTYVPSLASIFIFLSQSLSQKLWRCLKKLQWELCPNSCRLCWMRIQNPYPGVGSFAFAQFRQYWTSSSLEQQFAGNVTSPFPCIKRWQTTVPGVTIRQLRRSDCRKKRSMTRRRE